MSKTVAGVQTGYLYDGINPVRELNSDNSTKADLLTGGVDQFFARTANGTTSSFITDALGSTLALSDASGNLTTQYSYEAYGNTTASGAPSDNPFQFTGRENDGTGLYYYRARYFSPELSRFISEDPLGFGGGDVNLAAYVYGDPVSLKDPTGEFGIPGAIAGAIVGGISGAAGAYATGGNPWVGAAAGAATGAFFGGLGPLATLARTVAARAGAAAAANAVGQGASNYNNPCFQYNWASTAGSAVGGAFAGAWQYGFAGASAGFGSSVAGRVAFNFPAGWSAAVANLATNIYLNPNFAGPSTGGGSGCTCR